MSQQRQSRKMAICREPLPLGTWPVELSYGVVDSEVVVVVVNVVVVVVDVVVGGYVP